MQINSLVGNNQRNKGAITPTLNSCIFQLTDILTFGFLAAQSPGRSNYLIGKSPGIELNVLYANLFFQLSVVEQGLWMSIPTDLKHRNTCSQPRKSHPKKRITIRQDVNYSTGCHFCSSVYSTEDGRTDERTWNFAPAEDFVILFLCS